MNRSENSLLTVSQLSEKTGTAEAIVKFILDRFEGNLPADRHNGEKVYGRHVLSELSAILSQMRRGQMLSDIEKNLGTDTGTNDVLDTIPASIAAFLDKFNLNQQRIAEAYEKRAGAEERKAAAMEKRAQAEEEKVRALNSIAGALQRIQHNRTQDPDRERIVHQTEKAIKTDDLSLLVGSDSPPFQEQETDDRSILTAEEPSPAPVTDDLSLLVADESPQGRETDDLSQLVEDTPAASPAETDDLSLLTDEKSPDHAPPEPDDLYALVADKQVPEPSKKATSESATNDLSVLVDDHADTHPHNEEEPSAALKPAISPEDDFEKYKADIIRIIIDLKNKGITPSETCEKFNGEGIKTLSGKAAWSEKTISRIYEYIDSVS